MIISWSAMHKLSLSLSLSLTLSLSLPPSLSLSLSPPLSMPYIHHISSHSLQTVIFIHGETIVMDNWGIQATNHMLVVQLL